TRSLVEHLSTDLPSTYKGLMGKNYNRIEAREVATNGTPNDRRENFERTRTSWDNNQGQKGMDRFSPYRGPKHGLLSNLSKSPREILTTEKAARSFEQAPLKSGQLVHLVKGVKKKEWVSDTYLGEWKKGGKDATPIEAPILIIRRESYNPRKRLVEGNNNEVGEITFPPLRNISSADPVIIKAYVSGRQVNRVDSKIPLVGFSGEKSWALGEVTLEITIGEGPLITTKHSILLSWAIKFYTPQGIGTVLSQYNPREPEEEQRATSEEHQEEVKDILSCVDAEERIVVNDQYPKQTIAIGRQLPTKTKIRLQDHLRAYADVFAWTTAYMMGVPRTIIIAGEYFNTEHIVNKLKHLEPVKQKKRSLAPERNESIHT
ncbi:hypothetical protein Tco_1408204, partial [Tanacetum coccineum]